jgi:glutamyl-tRNA synthetase
VVRLGWSHGDDEVIPREKQIEWFDFSGVGATSGVWNPDKLTWLNQHYLKTLPIEEVAERLIPFLAERRVSTPEPERLHRLVKVFRERSKTLVEMAETAKAYFSLGVTLDEKAASKHLTKDSKPLLEQVRQKLTELPAWEPTSLEGVVKVVSEAAGVGMGKVAQPIRVAVTGGTASPGIGETLELIGREETLSRIDAALASIG